ncbi:unnamed protein product, partial [Phaeothamnion confervicola]
LPRLRRLSLHGANRVSRPALARLLGAFGRGAASASRRELTLKTSLVDCAFAVAAIAPALHTCRGLEALDLSHNRIGLAGAAALAAAAADAPRLRLLRLRSNSLGDAAAELLVRAWLGLPFRGGGGGDGCGDGGGEGDVGVESALEAMDVHDRDGTRPGDRATVRSAEGGDGGGGRGKAYGGPMRTLDISSNEFLTERGAAALLALVGRGGEQLPPGGGRQPEGSALLWRPHRPLRLELTTALLERAAA